VARRWRLRGVHRAALRVLTAAPRDGGTRPGTSGSVNIMTAPFELCVRTFDRVVSPPPAAGGPQSESAPSRPPSTPPPPQLRAPPRPRRRARAQHPPLPTSSTPTMGSSRRTSPLCAGPPPACGPPQPRTLPDPILGCFISGMDSATHSFIVMRAVLGLLNGAERCTPSTQFTLGHQTREAARQQVHRTPEVHDS
jgi:hypothetical protein